MFEPGNSIFGDQTNSETTQNNQSQTVLARAVVQNKRVELFPHLSSFIVAKY